MKHKAMPARVKQAGPDDGLAEGQFTAVVSVFGNVDEVGDMVMPGAFTKSLAKWRSSGDPIPVWWSHGWDNPAYNVGWVVDAKEVLGGPLPGLEVTGQLAIEEPTAMQVYRLLKGRRVTQFSFAYDEVDSVPTRDKEGNFVNQLRELDLHEVGPTAVGANRDTALLGVKQGDGGGNGGGGTTISQATIDKISQAEDALDSVLSDLGVSDPDQPASSKQDGDGHTISQASVDKLVAIDKLLVAVLDTLGAGDEGDSGNGSKSLTALIDARIKAYLGGYKSAVGVHHTATNTGAWDGGAHESRFSQDLLPGAGPALYAWKDPDKDPATQQAWKFIHHFVGANGRPGAASTRACIAGIAVLNGGRGGANIPDADRQGVYRHLAAHLRDANIEPPELKAAKAGQPNGTEDLAQGNVVRRPAQRLAVLHQVRTLMEEADHADH